MGGQGYVTGPISCDCTESELEAMKAAIVSWHVDGKWPKATSQPVQEGDKSVKHKMLVYHLEAMMLKEGWTADVVAGKVQSNPLLCPPHLLTIPAPTFTTHIEQWLHTNQATACDDTMLGFFKHIDPTFTCALAILRFNESSAETCDGCGFKYRTTLARHREMKEHNLVVSIPRNGRTQPPSFTNSYKFLNGACLAGTATIVDYLNYDKTDQAVAWFAKLGLATAYDKRPLQGANLKCGYIALAAVSKFEGGTNPTPEDCLDSGHVRRVNQSFLESGMLRSNRNKRVSESVMAKVSKDTDSAPALNPHELEVFMDKQGLKASIYSFDDMFWNVGRMIKKYKDDGDHTPHKLTFIFTTSFQRSTELTHYVTVHWDFNVKAEAEAPPKSPKLGPQAHQMASDNSDTPSERTSGSTEGSEPNEEVEEGSTEGGPSKRNAGREQDDAEGPGGLDPVQTPRHLHLLPHLRALLPAPRWLLLPHPLALLPAPQ